MFQTIRVWVIASGMCVRIIRLDDPVMALHWDKVNIKLHERVASFFCSFKKLMPSALK